MPDARTEILARVRTAHAGRPGEPVAAETAIPRDYRHVLAGEPDRAALVALATDRISHYKATVHHTDAGQLAASITAILHARSVHQMVAPADLPESWRTAGITWHIDHPHAPLSTAELDAVDGVLTGCAAAIAETGTIVLDAGPTQGRRVLTLLPDYHVRVLNDHQIVGSVPEAIERLSPARPLTFISGPSATSDIEFHRVEGVHGPRTLDVLIVS